MPFYNIRFENKKYRMEIECTVEGKVDEKEEVLAKRVTDPVIKNPGWEVVENSKREVKVTGGR